MPQQIDTAQPFTTTPTTPDALHKKLGVYCVAWEQMVLNAMAYLLGSKYQGEAMKFVSTSMAHLR